MSIAVAELLQLRDIAAARTQEPHAHPYHASRTPEAARPTDRLLARTSEPWHQAYVSYWNGAAAMVKYILSQWDDSRANPVTNAVRSAT
jgi:hypothetical protein